MREFKVRRVGGEEVCGEVGNAVEVGGEGQVGCAGVTDECAAVDAVCGVFRV